MLELKINRAIHDCEFRLRIIQARIDRGYGNKETEEMKENVLLEIEALRALEKSMLIKDILGNDYNLDRLRELVQADREGRCVLLPCKAGDTFRHNGLDYKADHWSVILSAFAKDRFAKTGKRICMFTVEDVAEKMAEEMEEQPE